MVQLHVGLALVLLATGQAGGPLTAPGEASTIAARSRLPGDRRACRAVEAPPASCDDVLELRARVDFAASDTGAQGIRIAEASTLAPGPIDAARAERLALFAVAPAAAAVGGAWAAPADSAFLWNSLYFPVAREYAHAESSCSLVRLPLHVVLSDGYVGQRHSRRSKNRSYAGLSPHGVGH